MSQSDTSSGREKEKAGGRLRSTRRTLAVKPGGPAGGHSRLRGMVRVRRLLAGLVLCAMTGACAARSAPSSAAAADGEPRSAPVAARASAVPAGGLSPERAAFWAAVRADKDRPLEGADVRALALELCGQLSSPDEAVRDGLAYEVLARWIRIEPRLSADDLRALMNDLYPRLDRGLGSTADDTVFGRSFSALVLSVVAAREVDAPFLSNAELAAMVDRVVGYAGKETDFRGRVEGRGWAHAAAHSSDWMKFLARHPRLTPAQARSLLDGVLSLAVRRHGFILYHGEDGRMAQPVLELLRRERIDAAAFDGWLARLAEPLQTAGGEGFDAALYAAQRNARNLVFTLFVALSVEDATNPAETAALGSLRKLIAR